MGNNKGTEAQKYVWEGAIPLQIHLHESEVTTLPRPPPALCLTNSCDLNIRPKRRKGISCSTINPVSTGSNSTENGEVNIENLKINAIGS